MPQSPHVQNDATSGPGPSSAPQVFYRFEDENGTLHLSDSLEHIPAAARARAERVALDSPATHAPHATEQSALHDSGTPESGALGAAGVSIHWPSFGLGMGLCLVLCGLLLLGRGGGKGRLWIGALSLLCLVALGTGFYFGALRRLAGTENAEGNLLASPVQIIEDARRTVEQVKAQRQEQDRMLEQIQRESH